MICRLINSILASFISLHASHEMQVCTEKVGHPIPFARSQQPMVNPPHY